MKPHDLSALKKIESCGEFVVGGGVLKGDDYSSGCYVKPVIAEVSNDMDIVWEAKYNLNLGLIHRAYRAHSLYPVEASADAQG